LVRLSGTAPMRMSENRQGKANPALRIAALADMGERLGKLETVRGLRTVS